MHTVAQKTWYVLQYAVEKIVFSVLKHALAYIGGIMGCK